MSIDNENNSNILDIYDFEEMREDYLIELEIRNYSPNTIKTYSSIIHTFNSYLYQQKSIKNKKEFIKYFRRYIQFLKRDLQVSQNYIYLVTVVLKKFLEYNNLDYLEEITAPKRTKALPKSLNENEVESLIQAVTWNKEDSPSQKLTKIRDKLILMLLYSSGLRVSELINITIKNIDFKERTILIRGKGDKDRVVLFDKKTKRLMQEYLSLKSKDSEYLVINKFGNALSARYIQFMIKKYANKAGIEKKVTPHVLRHSYATHLLKNGVDIRVIQQLLGHNSLSTTQIYTSVDMQTIKTIYDNAKN